MRKSKIIILVLSLCILTLNILSFAQPLSDLDSKTLAISLVIDTSGSMNRTDPQRLRQAVADVFIDYLNPEDYLGIITFDTNVDTVVAIDKLDNDARRNNIKGSLAPHLDGIGDTDYKAALDTAYNQLASVTDTNVTKMIVFLTDGQPDPNPTTIRPGSVEMEDYMASLWESVARIGNNQIAVLSVGFSDGIDVDVLARIASETHGDVRIYKDATELDENLVQLLNSRKSLVKELLELPHLALMSDFWFRKEGYRKGETLAISASVARENTGAQLVRGLDIESFQLFIEYDDGTVETISLYDDGDKTHSDVRANDGIYSNNITFKKNGNASGRLRMTGKIYNEDITLEKELGDFFVTEPGSITVLKVEDSIRVKKGTSVKFPIYIKNDSELKETLVFSIDESIGTIANSRINLEPSSYKSYDLLLDLNPDLEGKKHKINLSIESVEEATSLNENQLEMEVEIFSNLDNLVYHLKDKGLILISVLAILVIIPLSIYLFGSLLYAILVRPQLQISGTIRYWRETEPETSRVLDLTSLKKSRIIISFNGNRASDYRIDSNLYNYDLVINKELVKKGKNFILGWKALFSRTSLTELYIETTLPGIIEIDGEILTRLSIRDDARFTSGGYGFSYSRPKTKASKQDEGKDLLEARL